MYLLGALGASNPQCFPRSHGLLCDLSFISNSILPILAVGQIVKTPPPPTESVSAHLCWEAVDKFWKASAKIMEEVYLAEACLQVDLSKYKGRGRHTFNNPW